MFLVPKLGSELNSSRSQPRSGGELAVAGPLWSRQGRPTASLKVTEDTLEEVVESNAVVVLFFVSG